MVLIHVLRQLAKDGMVVPTDLVCREGLNEWIPASRVRGLFASVQAEVGPPPLPPTGTGQGDSGIAAGPSAPAVSAIPSPAATPTGAAYPDVTGPSVGPSGIGKPRTSASLIGLLVVVGILVQFGVVVSEDPADAVGVLILAAIWLAVGCPLGALLLFGVLVSESTTDTVGVVLIGRTIGLGVVCLVGALLLGGAADIACKFKVPYWTAYKACFISGIIGLALAIIRHAAVFGANIDVHVEPWLCPLLVLGGMSLNAMIYGTMLKHPIRGRIGFTRGLLVQLAAWGIILVASACLGVIVAVVVLVMRAFVS